MTVVGSEAQSNHNDRRRQQDETLESIDTCRTDSSRGRQRGVGREPGQLSPWSRRLLEHAASLRYRLVYCGRRCFAQLRAVSSRGSVWLSAQGSPPIARPSSPLRRSCVQAACLNAWMLLVAPEPTREDSWELPSSVGKMKQKQRKVNYHEHTKENSHRDGAWLRRCHLGSRTRDGSPRSIV